MTPEQEKERWDSSFRESAHARSISYLRRLTKAGTHFSVLDEHNGAQGLFDSFHTSSYSISNEGPRLAEGRPKKRISIWLDDIMQGVSGIDNRISAIEDAQKDLGRNSRKQKQSFCGICCGCIPLCFYPIVVLVLIVAITIIIGGMEEINAHRQQRKAVVVVDGLHSLKWPTVLHATHSAVDNIVKAGTVDDPGLTNLSRAIVEHVNVAKRRDHAASRQIGEQVILELKKVNYLYNYNYKALLGVLATAERLNKEAHSVTSKVNTQIQLARGMLNHLAGIVKTELLEAEKSARYDLNRFLSTNKGRQIREEHHQRRQRLQYWMGARREYDDSQAILAFEVKRRGLIIEHIQKMIVYANKATQCPIPGYLEQDTLPMSYRLREQIHKMFQEVSSDEKSLDRLYNALPLQIVV